MAKPEQPQSAMPAGGPRERFRQAVRLYSAALFRYCFGRLGDRHLAEDAVQETFLRAYRALTSGSVDMLPGWLFGTARRCCLELGRKRRRLEVGGQGRAAVTADPAAPVGQGGAAGQAVEDALEHLSDAERALIHLKHVEGMKCREIAAALGKPLGTVTGTLARAYGKLRRDLRTGEE